MELVFFRVTYKEATSRIDGDFGLHKRHVVRLFEVNAIETHKGRVNPNVIVEASTDRRLAPTGSGGDDQRENEPSPEHETRLCLL